MNFIKKIPIAISGVALSLAALGNLLLPYGEAIRHLCGILSAAILVLFALKLIFDFGHSKEELKNPVVLSTFPTSTMTVMLLCTYIKPYTGLAAIILWYAAIISQVFVMLLFVKQFVIGFSVKNVFPSWFVTGVGIVAASITSQAMNARQVGQIAFYLGFALYFIILPAIVFRMVKVKPIPEPARPTIAIFTAPMSLCIAGFLSAFEQPDSLLVYAMLAICVISYIYVTVNMISLVRLKFYPTDAAFTFPYVISAVAFKSANAFLVKNGLGFFSSVPKISEWIAIVVVAYVLVRYVAFIVSTPTQESR
jgi:exfoliative toxin A/B